MSDEHHEHDEELDAEVVSPSPGSALEAAPPPPATLSVTPQVGAGELSERLAVIEEAMQNSMIEGIDYGKVPGTDKPALFKPGSEKLSVLFQLDIQPRSTKTWGPGEHLTVETAATVFHIPTGARMGYGEGLCTTRERKYRYRRAGRKCPECGQETVIKGKEEYGGGWLCFLKKGGCGAKWPDGDEAIEGQEVGDVENPDLPDMWNTVIKMSAKRARVDAVLAVTGASALFTQDLDERGDATGNADAELEAATEEQKGRLNAALNWLLPPTEGERVWGEVKGAFGGALYGPVVEAVIAPIRALKDIRDDEAASEREAAEDDTRPQDEAEGPDDPSPEPGSQDEPEDKKPPAAKEKKGEKKS